MLESEAGCNTTIVKQVLVPLTRNDTGKCSMLNQFTSFSKSMYTRNNKHTCSFGAKECNMKSKSNEETKLT